MCNSFSHSSQNTHVILYFNIWKHGAWKSLIWKKEDHCLLILLAKLQVKQENIYFHILIYLWEAQLGWRNDAGILFSSWIIVSLKVDMVRTLDPCTDPFHLNSPAGVRQNLCERCRLLSWSSLCWCLFNANELVAYWLW